MEEDKDITELLLELAEEENRQLKYEVNVLKRLIKRQEQNFQNLVEKMDSIYNLNKRLN